MDREHMLVRIGVISMYIAVIFTLAAAVVVLALRGEPHLALATEPASQITEYQPVRPAKLLPEAEPPSAMPKPRPEPLAPEPPRPEPRLEREPPETRERPGPASQPEPDPPQKAQPSPKRQPASEPELKVEPEIKHDPKPAKPAPAPETRLDPRPKEPPEPKPAPKAQKESREAKERPEEKAASALVSRSGKVKRAARKQPAAGKAKPPDLPAGAVMTLSASALGLHDVPVNSSASGRALDGGVVHLPDTSLPWDSGKGGRNVYLAGHRLGWRGTGSHRIFYKLDDLRKGDWIVLKDARGRKYQYRVTGSSVVLPGESWVKDPVPGRDMLTLQTCTPIPTFEKRLIVRANRV